MSTEEPAPGAEIADNVARLRKSRRLSLRGLAGALAGAIDADGLNRIERGKRRVTGVELVALAEALGVSPATLLMPPEPPPGDRGEWEARWRWMHGELPLYAPGATDDPRGERDWHDRIRAFRRENRPYEDPAPVGAVGEFVHTLIPGRQFELELSSDGDTTTGRFTDLGPAADGERQ